MIEIHSNPDLSRGIQKAMIEDMLTVHKIKTDRRVVFAARDTRSNEAGQYWCNIYSRRGEYLDGFYADDEYSLTRLVARAY